MEEWIKSVMRTIRHIKRAFLKQKLPATYQLKKQKTNKATEYLLEQTDNHQSIRGPQRKMTAEEIKKSGKPTKRNNASKSLNFYASYSFRHFCVLFCVKDI